MSKKREKNLVIRPPFLSFMMDVTVKQSAPKGVPNSKEILKTHLDTK